MITGYNTDVEYGGVTYHVQTEDKGLQTPLILSLVYSGGEILASKRSPYDDLVARGFDEKVLVTRLQRQHKLICAAVHAGRIEDLKRMSERDSAPGNAAAAAAADTTPPGIEAQISDVLAKPAAEDEGVTIHLLEETELRGGRTVNLQLMVVRSGQNGREAAAGIPLVVKTLGTDFAPQSTAATTDARGVAAVSISLPEFTAGRAAILVQAQDRDETGELRRIILPTQS